MPPTDLIAAYYAAFNAGDRPAMIALLTSDVAHDINQGARQTGQAAFADFMAHMDRCYSEQLTGITILTEPTGTRAAAEFTVHGTYKATDEGLPPATGQTYTLPAGAFFDIRDGRIARVSNTYNLADWLRQVGG